MQNNLISKYIYHICTGTTETRHNQLLANLHNELILVTVTKLYLAQTQSSM